MRRGARGRDRRTRRASVPDRSHGTRQRPDDSGHLGRHRSGPQRARYPAWQGRHRSRDRVARRNRRRLMRSCLRGNGSFWCLVAENIVYGLRLRKIDRDTIAKKLKAILETTKLEILAQRYPGELSGGQQQRVALARALIVEPETLLLDEPLSNLDANLREEMRFEIRRLHDVYRYTTVYVTHDQSEAMTTADLIAVMNAGVIDQLGTPEDIYDRPQSEFVARFIGASNVIKGSALDANHVAFAGATLQVTGAELKAGQSAAVAIRQHDIQLSTVAPQATQNVVKATVTRQVFLGASRDYMVEATDGTTLRIVTGATAAVPRGTEVWLTLPPERCRALSR